MKILPKDFIVILFIHLIQLFIKKIIVLNDPRIVFHGPEKNIPWAIKPTLNFHYDGYEPTFFDDIPQTNFIEIDFTNPENCMKIYSTEEKKEEEMLKDDRKYMVTSPSELIRFCLRKSKVHIRKTGTFLFPLNSSNYFQTGLSLNVNSNSKIVDGIESLNFGPPGFWRELFEVYNQGNILNISYYVSLVYSFLKLFDEGRVKIKNTQNVVFHDENFEDNIPTEPKFNNAIDFDPVFIDLFDKFECNDKDDFSNDESIWEDDSNEIPEDEEKDSKDTEIPDEEEENNIENENYQISVKIDLNFTITIK